MTRRCFVRLLLCCAGILAPTAAPAAEPTLAKRHMEVLKEQVIPAYKNGDPHGVLRALSPIIGRMDDERLRIADEALQQQNVPAARKLLAEGRRTLVEQGVGDRLPKATLREVAIVAPFFATEIRGVVDEVARDPLVSEVVPRFKEVSAYEKAFWKMHVMSNRLTNVRRLAQYMEGFVRQFRAAKLTNLQPHEREAIQTDCFAVVARIDELTRELEERGLEMRLDRLRTAANALLQPELSEEKFLAAFSVATDSRILKEFLAGGGTTSRRALSSPEALEEVVWLEAAGRERGGDLIAKSEWLYHGLHWWLRGRYGRGTDGFGLFKDSAAINSPEDMFRLIMPREPSEAARFVSDADNAYPVPRRHYYTWAWEDRVVPFRKIEGEFT